MKIAATLGLVFLLSALYLYSNWQEDSSQNTVYSEPQTLKILDERPSLKPKAKQLLDKLVKSPNQPTYINFWAYWCQPCLEELPWLNQFFEKQKNSGSFNIVYLNVDNNKKQKEKSKAFLNQHEIAEHDSMFSPLNHKLFAKMNVQMLPYHLFLDSNGELAAIYGGSILHQKEAFKKLWLQLLKNSQQSSP